MKKMTSDLVSGSTRRRFQEALAMIDGQSNEGIEVSLFEAAPRSSGILRASIIDVHEFNYPAIPKESATAT